MTTETITKSQIVDRQTRRLLVPGQRVDLKDGREAILIESPHDWTRSTWIAQILNDDPKLGRRIFRGILIEWQDRGIYYLTRPSRTAEKIWRKATNLATIETEMRLNGTVLYIEPEDLEDVPNV